MIESRRADSAADGAAGGGLTLFHTRIGRNGDPGSKIEDFAAALRAGLGGQVDLALFKLCYVDVTTREAAQRAMTHYVTAIEQLAREFPQLAIGHVTMPLRCPPTGMLAFVHERIRGTHAEHARNDARNWFNTELAAQYAERAPLFDLAQIESRRPNGRCHGRRRDGHFIPALAPEYTKDGGHLNARGRRIAARAFLEFLRRSQGPSCRLAT